MFNILTIMKDLILVNSTHYQGNNKYVYKLPSSVTLRKGTKLSLYSFSMYNSTYNISSTLNNNKFSIIWLGTSYNFTIPNGYYSLDQLNNYLQFCMLSNNLYFKTTTAPVYPISISANSVQYSAQINVLYIPTSAGATTLGYTKPTGASWNFPVSNSTPQFVVNSGLQSILGFQNGQSTFPESVQTTNQQFISSALPILSPVYCYIVTCNLLNSNYSNIPNMFTQIPINVEYGKLIQFTNAFQQQIDVREGVYNEIVIQLFDQNLNSLQFKDYELAMTLIIEEP
jgi:hypothetical protein